MPSLDVAINALRAKHGAAQFDAAAKKIQTSAAKVDRSVAKTDTKMATLGSTIAKAGAAFIASAAIYKGLRFLQDAIRVSAEYEAQLANVATMLDQQTMIYLPRYKEGVAALSIEFGEATGTLSKGLYDILSASIPAADALEVLSVAGQAAKAGLTDTGTSADALTTILNSYSMEATRAMEVSDILFATVKRGKTTYDQLAGGIGKVSSLAASAGLSLEEMSAALATMTRAGVQTDIAITSLKAIITTFLSPQKDAVKAAKEMGIELSANTLKTIGLTGVIQKLKGRQAEEVAAIFSNVRALTGLSALLQQADGLTYDLGQTTDATGNTLEAFGKTTDTTQHKLNQMSQAWTGLKRSIGDEAAPAVSEFADKVTILTPSLSVLIGKFIEFNVRTNVALNVMEALAKNHEFIIERAERSTQATSEFTKVTQRNISILSLGIFPMQKFAEAFAAMDKATSKWKIPSAELAIAYDAMAKTTEKFQKQIDDFGKTDIEKQIEQFRLLGENLNPDEYAAFNDQLERTAAKMKELEALEKGEQRKTRVKEALREEAEAKMQAMENARAYFREIELEREILFMTNEARERAIKLQQLENATKDMGSESSAALVEHYKKELLELQKAKESAAIVSEIRQGVGDLARAPLEALLSETKTFGDLVEDTLKNIGQNILRTWYDQMITQKLQGAVMSGLFGAAGGGAEGTTGLLGGLMTQSAKGNAFSMGSVVRTPTVFPMANGAGIMAEDKPEAVMPLDRNSQGKLSVNVTGGSENPVNITNILDPSVMDDYVMSPRGERRIINMIRANKEALEV